jgi:hypothetical protein
VAGCCEYGNEPSSSINCLEFYDSLRTSCSQEELCCMKLVESRKVPEQMQFF